MNAPLDQIAARIAIRPLTAVVRVRGAYLTVAIESVSAGSLILELMGRLTDRPSQTSVQVADQLHVDLPRGCELEDALDRYHWRFLNHSCAPNAAMHGNVLVALRDIAPWEELTFDYETTELEVASPFLCACGAEHCRGTIRGYRYLSERDRALLQGRVAAHLLSAG